MLFLPKIQLVLCAISIAANGLTLSLLSPLGGEEFQVGDTVHIKWQATPNWEVVCEIETIDPFGSLAQRIPIAVMTQNRAWIVYGIDTSRFVITDIPVAGDSLAGLDWILSDSLYLGEGWWLPLEGNGLHICIYFFAADSIFSRTSAPIVILAGTSCLTHKDVRYSFARALLGLPSNAVFQGDYDLFGRRVCVYSDRSPKVLVRPGGSPAAGMLAHIYIVKEPGKAARVVVGK